MFDRSCEVCGASINLLRADARTCSPRCRKRLSRKSPFPAEMVGADRWVRRERSKRPVTVEGAPASSTDAATWSSYLVAARSTVGVGLGFVLGDGIGCVDLDDCFDDAGELVPWAAVELADRAADALFVEVSQSGRGLHIFVPMSAGKGRVIREGGRRVEVYPPDSGRYIAVTGRRFEGVRRG